MMNSLTSEHILIIIIFLTIIALSIYFYTKIGIEATKGEATSKKTTDDSVVSNKKIDDLLKVTNELKIHHNNNIKIINTLAAKNAILEKRIEYLEKTLKNEGVILKFPKTNYKSLEVEDELEKINPKGIQRASVRR